jgi:hypothetical protein
MELLTTLVIVALGFWAGWISRGVTILSRLGSDPEHFIKILQEIKKINQKEKTVEEEKVNGTELKIERHGDTLYAFIKDTDQFVAQGPDLSSLIEQAQKRFPGRKFFGLIPNGDPAKELV